MGRDELHHNNNDTNAQKWKLNFIAETSKSIEDGTYIINSQLDENKAIVVPLLTSIALFSSN